MFKRLNLFTLLLFVSLLVACSDDQAEEPKDNKGSENDEQSVDVDKGLLNVEITLPSDLFEDEDLDQVIENAKEQGVSKVTKNDDGSLTYKMSKSVHDEMLQEIEESVDGAVEEAKQNSESIKDITSNKALTEFTLLVDREAFENSFDGFVSITLGISGIYYQIFAGENADDAKVTIHVEDEASGEVFDTIVYPDVLEEEQENE